MSFLLIRALLISIAVLAGLVAALVAGLLARLGGATYPDAVARGGATLVVVIPTVILLMEKTGLLGAT
ncbi:hypothetical protein [Streptomyces yangpuensis]|uniref:hypothetical protein n=1 Tax=Streptomyces yangpuensis TaxID=1648182 RepID=UPI00380AD109